MAGVRPHQIENAPLIEYQMSQCSMLNTQNFSSRCARIVLVQNEKIISLDGYVTIPGASLFTVAAATRSKRLIAESRHHSIHSDNNSVRDR
jgi:hypothetical protein